MITTLDLIMAVNVLLLAVVIWKQRRRIAELEAALKAALKGKP